ncbi:MAG TPA: family 20 glycosylhydrolase, partial [Acidobacteriaceae bacterium]|nr:family 20 glycosylhydrolase [Acidobacteriaceae bacterium]
MKRQIRSVAIGVLAGAWMAGAAIAQMEFVNTLMPEPAQMSVGNGRLNIAPGFTVVIDKFHDDRLEDAVHWAMQRLAMQTGVTVQNAAQGGSGALIISVDAAGEPVQGVDEDESYSLEITGANAHLHAATDVGAMHGLETLLQLVQSDGQGFWLPAVTIQDSPRFKWRGLMIDCSRHFEPVGVLLRTLDAMASVKMNVFHWHLSDDQGFRMESKIFPNLTGAG